MEDRPVHYAVVGTFESAHSAALSQVELLNRGVTAHVWPNDDPTADPFAMWFVIVPGEQAGRAEAALRAMAGPQPGGAPPARIAVNGTAI